MKKRVLFGCIVFGLIMIAVIAAIEDKTMAVKPDEAEQGDRSCDWMTSGVYGAAQFVETAAGKPVILISPKSYGLNRI